MSRRGDETGFSLVEVLVASAVLIALLVPMLRFFDSAVSGAAELQASTQHQADARFVVDRLVREVRQAHTGTVALDPVEVTPLTLTVHSPDTSTPYRLRRIEYRLVDGRLERAVTWSDQDDASGPPWTWSTERRWEPVMTALTEPAFTETVVDGATRRVDIVLQGGNGGSRAERTYRTNVQLRIAP